MLTVLIFKYNLKILTGEAGGWLRGSVQRSMVAKLQFPEAWTQKWSSLFLLLLGCVKKCLKAVNKTIGLY